MHVVVFFLSEGEGSTIKPSSMQAIHTCIFKANTYLDIPLKIGNDFSGNERFQSCFYYTLSPMGSCIGEPLLALFLADSVASSHALFVLEMCKIFPICHATSSLTPPCKSGAA